MNRRPFLALVGGGLAAGGAAFGWRWYRSPSLPRGMSVETLHLEREVFLHEFSAVDGWREERYVLLGAEETAIERIDQIDAVETFVRETDFEESYVLVVQNGMQSDPDLELDAIERTDSGLWVALSIDAPLLGVNDDLVTHSLLIRVTDEEGPPDDVAIEIEGYV